MVAPTGASGEASRAVKMGLESEIEKVAAHFFSGKGAGPLGPPYGRGADALWPANLGGEFTLCSSNCWG